MVVVFLRGLIDIPEVYAKSDFPIFLVNRNQVSYPFHMSDEKHDPSREQLV